MKRNEVAARIALMLHEAGFTLMHEQYDIPLKHLGVDSLHLVELIMEIENAFNIFLLNTEIAEFNTANDLIDFVTRKMEVK